MCRKLSFQPGKASVIFRSGYPLKPWLVRILVNKIISSQRANQNPMISLDTESFADPAGDDPAEEIAQRDQLRRVNATAFQ